MLTIFAGMLIVIALGASSVILTALDRRVGPWEQMMYLMDRSNDLADSAILYRNMGMHDEADLAFAEAQQLNKCATSILFGRTGA